MLASIAGLTVVAEVSEVFMVAVSVAGTAASFFAYSLALLAADFFLGIEFRVYHTVVENYEHFAF